MNITIMKDVDAAWPMVAPLIVKCLEKTPSYMSAGELWQMCRTGQAFLIIAHTETEIKGASIWQFQQGYGRSVFDCLVLAGEDLGAWVSDLVSVAKKMAADGGATSLSATGRLGLIRSLKKHIPGLKVVRQSYLVEV